MRIGIREILAGLLVSVYTLHVIMYPMLVDIDHIDMSEGCMSRMHAKALGLGSSKDTRGFHCPLCD